MVAPAASESVPLRAPLSSRTSMNDPGVMHGQMYRVSSLRLKLIGLGCRVKASFFQNIIVLVCGSGQSRKGSNRGLLASLTAAAATAVGQGGSMRLLMTGARNIAIQAVPARAAT